MTAEKTMNVIQGLETLNRAEVLDILQQMIDGLIKENFAAQKRLTDLQRRLHEGTATLDQLVLVKQDVDSQIARNHAAIFQLYSVKSAIEKL